MSGGSSARRVVEVQREVIGPVAPRAKRLRARSLDDYPHVPPAYREVARKLASPLLMGPPICDELMDFVQHVFTEEEAAVVRHLSPFSPKTARQVARAELRPVETIEPLLRRLALEKRVIASWDGAPTRYQLLPIMPGMFEMVLVAETPETLTEWHRGFVERFEALYETGYVAAFHRYPSRTIRYLPVGRAIEAHPMALPSDHMEAVLDRFEVFGIGQCQCRTSMAALGQGCGKPLANCTVMGSWAEQGIARGWLRRASRREVLEKKQEAEANGLVSFVINVASSRGQVSCSCCGCCCKAMRTMTEFVAPSLVAPPHFLPKFDPTRCTFCGRCAVACPMGALVVHLAEKSRRHLRERCIGCGLCAVACSASRAITMEPVPDYRPPYSNWLCLLGATLAPMLKNVWNSWRSR